VKSPNTITEMVKRGLPAHKVGKGYRFDLAEVDEWIRSRWTAQTPGQTA
jgi:excisionase family DNA binding protein